VTAVRTADQGRGQESEDLALAAASGILDAAWYLHQYPDVVASGIDPLVHYLSFGWMDGRDPSPLFSTGHYLRENPDVESALVNPLVHYLREGWREGRSPFSGFRAPAMADSLPDICPLILMAAGYRETGTAQPLISLPRPLADRADRPATEPPAASPVTNVAFYLPQFHRIPENDAWWGSGFTEWTNVRRGESRFRGHHQPHVPGELGYYNLLDEGVLARQVELAKLHGIGAFCFYAYWFGGKRLLQTPLDRYLEDPDLDLPFLVCWANENWTRTWDGEDEQVLIGQAHGAKDDLAFIEGMSKYLRDPRYLRVSGKPLLLVYRPSLLPDARATTNRWRKWCRENAIGEIALAYVQGFDTNDPEVFGCDFAVEFPPNNTGPNPVSNLPESENFAGKAYDWRELAGRSNHYSRPAFRLWRGVCPSWDNEARRPGRGTVLVGAEPEGFRDWLVRAGEDTISRFAERDERLVFINAWNEWAEGAHLEPDTEFGYQWLHAVRDAQEILAGVDSGSGPGVVVVTHDMHKHGAQMLALNIAKEVRDLGRRVEVVALEGGELLGEFREIAKVHELPTRDGHAALAEELARRGFTTAICNTAVSGAFAAEMARAGARVVGLVHELPSMLNLPAVAPHAEKLAKAADALYFPAQFVADSFPFVVAHETVIRPQGLYKSIGALGSSEDREALHRRLSLPKDAVVVLGVGFGDHRKGMDVFAECAYLARDLADSSPLHFVWVGTTDGYDQRIVEALTRNGGENLHLPGFVQDPAPYYLGCDVLAITSREDPFPSVSLEALAAGVPCVAFAGCTGQEDLLLRTGGLLVASVDAQALLDQLVLALAARADEDPEDQRRRSQLIADEFNFRQYVMDLLAGTPAAMARVSVVLPNYQYESFIAERVRQVLEQTHPVYELIVLDDASTDRSVAEAAGALRSARCGTTLLINDVNSGSVFRQWSRGAALTKGELVWIAEADDLADPDLLKVLAAEMRRPSAVMAFAQSSQIGPDGELLAGNYREYTADVTSRDWTRRYRVSGEQELADCLAIKNTIPNASAVLFDGATLRDVMTALPEDFFVEFPTSGDWWIYAQILDRTGSTITFVPESLNAHRRHPASVIARGRDVKHVAEIRRMQQLIADRHHLSDGTLLAASAWTADVVRQFGLDG
jgi:glycosyltransferase involved in cell wall biosynthesis